MAADSPQATKHRPTDPVPSNTPFGEMKIPDPLRKCKRIKYCYQNIFFYLQNVFFLMKHVHAIAEQLLVYFIFCHWRFVYSP